MATKMVINTNTGDVKEAAQEDGMNEDKEPQKKKRKYKRKKLQCRRDILSLTFGKSWSDMYRKRSGTLEKTSKELHKLTNLSYQAGDLANMARWC